MNDTSESQVDRLARAITRLQGLGMYEGQRLATLLVKEGFGQQRIPCGMHGETWQEGCPGCADGMGPE